MIYAITPRMSTMHAADNVRQYKVVSMTTVKSREHAHALLKVLFWKVNYALVVIRCVLVLFKADIVQCEIDCD